MEGYVNNSTNAFIPVETTAGNAQLNPVYIGNLSLADNGIWAVWMLNSTIENIMDGPFAGRTCIDLRDNDYQDTIRRVKCQVVPKAQTFVGFLFMGQSNNNLYDHLQCDGQYTCIEELGGSGTYLLPDFTDRGYGIYPFAFIEAQALLNSPTTDIEGADTNFLGDIYSYNAYAPIEIHGGQLAAANSGPLLVQDGGAPFVAQGVDFSGTTPAEVVNVVNNPSSPATITDSTIPSGTPTANSGKSWWVKEVLGGQDSGVKFADLPGTVVNGTRRYCVDCDPPANPPVACTSAGAKTGAWIDGLNNSWICVP
jgi:hypothetical protein